MGEKDNEEGGSMRIEMEDTKIFDNLEVPYK